MIYFLSQIRSKKLSSVVIMITILIFSNLTQGKDIPHLELVAEHPREVLPWMPFDVKLTVTNRGERETFLPWFPPNRDQVRIRLETENGTLVYEGVAGRSLTSNGSHGLLVLPEAFASGTSKSFFVTLHCTWEEDNLPRGPLLRDPGVYRIMFRCAHAYSHTARPHPLFQVWSESKPAEIRVLDVPDHEATFRDLQRLSRPALLLEPNHEVFIARNQPLLLKQWDEELEAFLNRHGDSPWAPLAWLARATISYHRSFIRPVGVVAGGGQRDMDLVRLTARCAERAATTAKTHGIADTRDKALELWAAVLRDLGDMNKAHEISTVRHSEKQARQGFEPVTDPRDPEDARRHFERVFEQLKADGYDPAGLKEHAPEAWEEFDRFSTELTRQHLRGTLPVWDYYRQKAALLDRYVRKHVPPVSQEELAKVLEQRKEAQRQRQQAAAQRLEAMDPRERAERNWLIWKVIELNNPPLDAITDPEARKRAEREREKARESWLDSMPPRVAEETRRLLEQEDPDLPDYIREAWEKAVEEKKRDD